MKTLTLPLICTLLLASIAMADDVVVVSSGKDARGRARIPGVIVEYTGKELTLRQAGGRDSAIPADRVVAIESQWQQQHSAGDAQFDAGEFAKALDLYRVAVRDEQRTWARRQILARVVWCYHNLGQIEAAGATFLIILRSDPTTQYFDAIPLSWTTGQPSPALEREAKTWLADETLSPAALMGASWLLSTPDRSAAMAKLQRLTTDADPRVAQLAEAQLWRTKIVTSTPQEVAGWQQQVERIPSELRAGPYFALGQALARQNLHEQAALAFLRVPILHSSNRSLSADALLAAARALESLGQNDAAAGLYRELINDYATTAPAAEAQARLRNLAGEG
jgi:tetratricopeptide (TPR) repeat protein